MKLLTQEQREKRDRLLRYLPEVLAYAHALREDVALDLVAIDTAVASAGFATWNELDHEMMPRTAVLIRLRDEIQENALRERQVVLKRAHERFGGRGTILQSFLAYISPEMPPRKWHWRVKIADDGRILNWNLMEALAS